jgi:hypothetical protein
VPLAACFDASWTDDSILVVTGFLSSVKLLADFEKRWAKLLADAGVPYFRMAEFAHSTGVFKDWKGNEGRRRAFLIKAIDIICEHVWVSIAAGVVLPAWQQCNQRYRLDEEDFRPYALCGWTCVDHVRLWCRAQRRPYQLGDVLLVFEHGDPDQGQLRRRVLKDFGQPIEIREKIPTAGSRPLGALQAADFAAWNVRNVMLKYEGLEVFRKDFDALINRVPHSGYHAHFSMNANLPDSKLVHIRNDFSPASMDPSLVRFCKDYGVPSRP